MISILAALSGPNSKAPGFAGGYLLVHPRTVRNASIVVWAATL
jgi:hypothetical protein